MYCFSQQQVSSQSKSGDNSNFPLVQVQNFLNHLIRLAVVSQISCNFAILSRTNY